MSELVLSCEKLKKTYQGPASVHVLLGVNLEVHAGESIAIMGRSGSGKSTLLHLLGGLDVPSEGVVGLQGKVLNEMNEKERGDTRNRALGFVYQFHHLLPEFTALENVMLPVLLGGASVRDASAKSRTLLESVGLGHRLEHLEQPQVFFLL